MDDFLTRRGFWAVLAVRLIPLVPFTALNYLSGLTAVPARSYLAATVLGILPASTAYVALGAYGQRPGSWPFLAALGGLLLLSGMAVGAAVIRRSRTRRAGRISSRELTGPAGR